jgi:hypothetical protein
MFITLLDLCVADAGSISDTSEIILCRAEMNKPAMCGYSCIYRIWSNTPVGRKGEADAPITAHN